jgi:ubiquinone/menaquinone biosynthesis C-methylase UbiE
MTTEQTRPWDWQSDIPSSLEPRKAWYSDVADAYNRVRPRYSQPLIDRVIEIAHLPTGATLLEIGCGPGTATTSFASKGFAIVGLEPSPAAYQLACQNCNPFPQVEILNTTFEEWPLEPQRFNAVLAATSFHWVGSEDKYAKAKAALKDHGCLILLWNTALQPSLEVFSVLQQVYQTHAPALAGYEAAQRGTEQEHLDQFGQAAIASGQFKSLISEQTVCHVSYSIQDYLALLSTYSAYIALEPQPRMSLFTGLQEALDRYCGKSIELSYLSAFQIAEKV